MLKSVHLPLADERLFFSLARLVFASGLILLSPKRAIAQSAEGALSRASRNKCFYRVNYVRFAHIMRSRLGCAANRLTRLDVYSFPPRPCFCFFLIRLSIRIKFMLWPPTGWPAHRNIFQYGLWCLNSQADFSTTRKNHLQFTGWCVFLRKAECQQ